MPSRDFTRSDRISAELRRQLGAMVHEAVRDHALPSMSVSDVEVTRDFDLRRSSSPPCCPTRLSKA
jgi:ribosome-binding factor A